MSSCIGRHARLSAPFIASVAVLVSSSVAAQRPPVSGAPDAQLLPTFHVQGNIHLVVGPSANSVVLAGDGETLVLDTQPEALAPALVATVRALTNKPIRYIVSTHAHPDHTGGNAVVSKAGQTIGGFPSGSGIATIGGATSRAAIVAHENVLTRMSASASGPNAVPFEAWPTDTFFVDRDEIFVDEAVRIFHQPAAHTDGDVLVYFGRSDVIATGDLFSTLTYPIIDQAAGGTINGVIAALNQILELAVPSAKQEGGTYIVPGHGRVADEADVVEYRDLVTIIRDRVQALKSKGLTLAQVQAARPTVDYDPRYATPERTANAFIEAIYRTLQD